MKVLATESEGASVHLSLDELDALRNALNEARLLLKGRSGADFATRIGVTTDQADDLLQSFQKLIEAIDEKAGSRKPLNQETPEIKATR